MRSDAAWHGRRLPFIEIKFTHKGELLYENSGCKGSENIQAAS